VLRHRPHLRTALFALAICLPIYAEATSYLIYAVRPAPDTVDTIVRPLSRSTPCINQLTDVHSR